jgi:hypothetical protein
MSDNLPRGYIKSFLDTLAPNFCWMTANDLFLMLEQIYEDAKEDSFRSKLSEAVTAGKFLVRKKTGRGQSQYTCDEYLRNA